MPHVPLIVTLLGCAYLAFITGWWIGDALAERAIRAVRRRWRRRRAAVTD